MDRNASSSLYIFRLFRTFAREKIHVFCIDRAIIARHKQRPTIRMCRGTLQSEDCDRLHSRIVLFRLELVILAGTWLGLIISLYCRHSIRTLRVSFERKSIKIERISGFSNFNNVMFTERIKLKRLLILQMSDFNNVMLIRICFFLKYSWHFETFKRRMHIFVSNDLCKERNAHTSIIHSTSHIYLSLASYTRHHRRKMLLRCFCSLTFTVKSYDHVETLVNQYYSGLHIISPVSDNWHFLIC